MHQWKVMAVALVLPLGATSPSAADPCMPGPYILFFDPEIAYVDRAAREVLDHAAAGAADCGYSRTIVTGHADTHEKSGVAQKRAEVVRDYLAAHGIPRADITAEGLGTSRPRIVTPPNTLERQNRRVEILHSAPF